MHELGDGGFEHHLATAYGACIRQDFAVFVQPEVDHAGGLIGDEDVDAAVDSLLDHWGEGALGSGQGASTERSEDDAAQLVRAGIDEVFEQRWGETWGNEDDSDPRIETRITAEGQHWPSNPWGELYVDTELGEGLTSRAIEGVVGSGVALGGSTATQQQSIEADPDLGDAEGCKLGRVGEVAPCI